MAAARQAMAAVGLQSDGVGQGQFNSKSKNGEVKDPLTTSNDIKLFVTQQVYTSMDSCLNDAVTEAETLSIA